MDRIGAILLFFAMALPLLRDAPWLGKSATLPLQPVEGGVIRRDASTRTGPILSTRSNSPTDVCFRWAQQSAIVNGTLYLYGGEASTSADQTENTWNNDFLTLDLTTSWQIASPSLTGLPQPSGPPAVALGYLWNSHDSLYLYGGEFSWKPVKSPTAFSLWEYDIISQSWTEHSDPTTSSGDSAPDHGVAVQRAAEGAGASVPSLGRGFYFGGHQDGYTTQGWSQSVPRIYLQSLLEFTYPGYTNDAVTVLSNGKTAGTDGNYRNITEGGLQQSAGFTERADGLLVHVPGFGDQGILLALAGGTNETFTQMNEIDVYDIANSTWYKQSTSGSTPNMRVNPCAVAASAPDGSSTNIYMFGGQNLIPYDNQTEYNDMWILTLPSFTWIEVDQGNQSVPYGRSGHTCNIWDAQMVVVGGYVGDQLSCESPGIYVYDLSNVEWIQQFTARSSGTDDGSSGSGLDSTKTATASGSKSTASTNFISTSADNPFNQQPAQIGNGSSSGGLEGSYGYTVPQIVIDVIGGGPSGGATVTKPVVTATAGPLATGSAVTYTVTSADGSTATETASASSGGTGSSSSGGSGGPNIAAIVVGVICGLLFLVACYLAFCLYVYRKQIQLYKRHAEMAQRQARGEKTPAVAGLLASDSSNKTSDERRRLADGTMRLSESASQNESYGGRSADQTSSSGRPDYGQMRRDSDGSSMDNLLVDHEPTFVGVMLNPRRSLRVINRD
ncbi:kelch repeat-containing protein [Teratosphaeria destructans]|uniref:Kelch repeat-containing protein n=1 Tax=Teratosphaeria destructans TaxID=418781 RepID=A0A9W7SJ85_9PEZI|nr:kelch repeat-containing protein [Teratosphaeria destructans]